MFGIREFYSYCHVCGMSKSSDDLKMATFTFNTQGRGVSVLDYDAYICVDEETCEKQVLQNLQEEEQALSEQELSSGVTADNDDDLPF